MWCKKEFPNALEAAGPIESIKQVFIAAMRLAGTPGDMAIFTRHDLDSGMLTVYFSPSASNLAISFGTSPCPKPLRDRRLVLLAGDATAFEIHYPGSQAGK